MEPLLRDRRVGRPLDVVGLGEISLDHVAEVERFPSPGEKLPMAGFQRLPGGQMATAIRACARLGLRAALLGSVGDDEAAEIALRPLREAGIDLSGVRAVPGAETRFAWILVDRTHGERTILWRRDPALAAGPESVTRAAVCRGRALHLDTTDPDLSLWAARAARAEGIPVFLDADTDTAAVRALLAEVDFPVISQRLARSLAGSQREADALGFLLRGRARYAVVTVGERGAFAGSPEAPLHEPAFSAPVRDTTGAGDVFHAAFVAAALEGASGPEAVRFANAAAAWSVAGLGAQGALPSRADVESLLASGRPRRAAPAGAA